jgi:hypothetical protein
MMRIEPVLPAGMAAVTLVPASKARRACPPAKRRTPTVGTIANDRRLSDAIAMTRSAPPLSYDTAVGRPNRWVRRGLLLAAIAIALGFGSVWIGPLWRQSQLLWWQHKCMVHVPSGQRYPKEWDRFAALANPGIRMQGTLFVHEVISPAGHRRLVAVVLGGYYTGSSPIPGPGEVFTTWIVAPAEFPIHPARVVDIESTPVWQTSTTVSTFDEGWADPADRSHFQLNLGPGMPVFDGWLRDDDKIHLEVRKPK